MKRLMKDNFCQFRNKTKLEQNVNSQILMKFGNVQSIWMHMNQPLIQYAHTIYAMHFEAT